MTEEERCLVAWVLTCAKPVCGWCVVGAWSVLGRHLAGAWPISPTHGPARTDTQDIGGTRAHSEHTWTCGCYVVKYADWDM